MMQKVHCHIVMMLQLSLCCRISDLSLTVLVHCPSQERMLPFDDVPPIFMPGTSCLTLLLRAGLLRSRPVSPRSLATTHGVSVDVHASLGTEMFQFPHDLSV